jgi:hypothetical protein
MIHGKRLRRRAIDRSELPGCPERLNRRKAMEGTTRQAMFGHEHQLELHRAPIPRSGFWDTVEGK